MAHSVYRKFVRGITGLVLPVEESRAGECKNCGACCMFVVRCPFLKFEHHSPVRSVCTIHKLRPPQCRKYPRTKKEQAHQPCGYYFKS